MAELPIPRSLDEITPDWLTAALRRSRAIREAAVSGLDVQLIGEGEGFLGQVGRITPTYDRQETAAPESVVVKLASRSGATRKHASDFGLYETEVRFYHELSSRVTLPAPRCHAAAFDAASGGFLLLLEDLGDMRHGGDLRVAKEDLDLAVDTLAGLHAQWWESPQLDEFEWLTAWSGVPPAAGFDETWRAAAADLGARLPPAASGLADRYTEYRRSMGKGLLRPPLTLLHGDYRLENMFFARDDEATRRFALIDFQLVRRACGAHDLAWFLCAGLEVERRRELEEEIVRRYHSGLREAGVKEFGLDDCWAGYRACVLAAFLRLVYSYTSLRPNDAEGGFRAMVERSAAAVADLDAEALVADL